MLFAIGTRVKFLHTGDEGVVKSMLDGGMVSVYLPAEDMEIPAFPDDLIRAEKFMAHPVKAKIIEGKKAPAPPQPPPMKIETQYAILKSYGIQLAFEPSGSAEPGNEKYAVYLLNDTKYDVLYAIKFLLNYRRPVPWDGKIAATSIVRLGEMLYDDLNESPEFEIECRWISTEGVDEPVFKSLKIKPKTFFSSLRTVPLLNQIAHLYRLFEKPEAQKAAPQDDLSAYTKRHAKPVFTRSNLKMLDLHDSKEYSEFSPEIDLHIEKLLDNYQKLSNAEILAIQLSRFDDFLAKAILLGVKNVFVIHGVGEGRLRNEIATRLLQNPDVETFKNEYHPRYGWGATEIIL